MSRGVFPGPARVAVAERPRLRSTTRLSEQHRPCRSASGISRRRLGSGLIF
jgi:hypothetical protein